VVVLVKRSSIVVREGSGGDGRGSDGREGEVVEVEELRRS
jgi:hypothetical protein